MKNFTKPLYAVCVMALAGCSWKTPESFSITTDANYNFSIGTVSKGLADTLSAKKLSEQFNKAGGGSSSTSKSYELNFYDYTGENTAYRQFLADIKFEEMEFDISKILPENINFTSSLGDAVSSPIEAQKITIPNLSAEIGNQELPLEFGNLSKEIPQMLSFTSLEMYVPDQDGAVDDDVISPITVNFSIDGGGNFDSIQFASINAGEESNSYMIFTISPLSAIAPGFSAQIGCTLYDTTDSLHPVEISHTDPVLLSNTDATVIHLPLDGKSIGKNFSVGFSGTLTGSGTPGLYKYNVDMEFSDTSEIYSIHNATMDLSAKPGAQISFTQEIPKPDNEMFVQCTIGAGSIKIKCPSPENWTGLVFSSDFTMSGGLSAVNSEIQDGEADGHEYIINKKIPLDGKIYRKEKIEISCTLSVKLQNAHMEFSEDAKKVTVQPSCEITTLSSAVADLRSILHDAENNKSRLSYTVSHDIGSVSSDASKYLKYITLDAGAGIRLPYSNTLPGGNSIGVKFYSDFLGLGSASTPETATIEAFGNLKEEDGSAKVGKLEFVTAAQKEVDVEALSKIDFSVEMELPGRAEIVSDFGSTSEYDYYTQLSNVEMGGEYMIDVKKPEPSFEWIDAGIKTDEIENYLTNSMNTGLDLSSMMKPVTDALGDSKFIESISIPSIPIFLYITMPNLQVFNDLDLKATVLAEAVDPDTSLPNKTVVLVGTENSDGTVTPGDMGTLDAVPMLDSDENLENNLVTKPVSKAAGKVSAHSDIARLFDPTVKGSLGVRYEIKPDGSVPGVMVVTKEMFDGLAASTSETSTGIGIHARIVLPLNFNIDTDDNSDLEIDIMKILKKNSEEPSSDLFGRKEATKTGDGFAEKFIPLIEYAKISYTLNNELFAYSDSSKSFSIVMDPKIPGLNEYKLVAGKGEIKISTQELVKMMETYPFAPDLKVVLPEGYVCLPLKSSIGANVNLEVKTNGTVTVWEK